MVYKKLELLPVLFFGLSLHFIAAQTVRDIDDNIYKTVTIGNQTWMAENLRTTSYNDGTAITLITDDLAWSDPSNPGYCWYNNDEASYKSVYGAIYNWYAVDSSGNGGKNVCPAGWRVPGNSDWLLLSDYLIINGYGYEGSGSDIAKSVASASGWTATLTAGNIGNDQPGNNRSGFTALPGGYRDFDGTFDGRGGYGGWWISSEYDISNAWSLVMIYSSSDVSRLDYSKLVGYYIRCIKNY